MNSTVMRRVHLGPTVGSLVAIRELPIALAIVLVGVAMTILSPVFLTLDNLESVLLGLTVEGTMAVGMVIVLVSGGFDLSVGSTLAFAGVVAGLALSAGLSAPLAVLLGIASAVGVGVVNGSLIALVGINPFVATLGTQIAIRGLLLVMTSGVAVLNLPSSFTVIGQGDLWGLQYPIWVMLVIVLGMDVLLRNNRFLRQNYYIGGNVRAAWLSGINVRRVLLVDYCLSAALAGIAGLLITARFGSASVTVGTGTELRVLTAAILGGASLSGGQGSVLGAFLGAAFMGVLADSLNLLGVGSYWQDLVTGVILIGAVVLDVVTARSRNGSR